MMEIAKRSYLAFIELQKFNQKERANFLRSIANNIEEIGETLILTASEESNLPTVRFEGERARTCFQLRMFADLIEDGSWQNVCIDTAIPDRKPLPKPDLRMYKKGIGPIVVFGASNFPLAYSTAGGDTASALAAGCPVIYKVHPAHPKTSILVAQAIEKAITEHNFPNDTFIHFDSNDFDEIKTLIQDPLVQGVGFTGSYLGGMSIYNYAKERKQPIPIFCEMGSVNPVILLPNELKQNAENWAIQYSGSITMGVGQFCTNPGLLFGIKGEELNQFISILGKKISESKDFKMLHEGIYQSYCDKKAKVINSSNVELIAEGEKNIGGAIPTLVKVSANTFRNNSFLHEEVFGPFSIIIECENFDELKSLVSNFEGQLTSSIIHGKGDEKEAMILAEILENKVGRIVFNGVPTGVEVCNSMVHGGPFPATTDSRFTAVGNNAINRWVRPVSFQNCPNFLLPDELKNENPLGLWRNINGTLTKEAVLC